MKILKHLSTSNFIEITKKQTFLKQNKNKSQGL